MVDGQMEVDEVDRGARYRERGTVADDHGVAAALCPQRHVGRKIDDEHPRPSTGEHRGVGSGAAPDVDRHLPRAEMGGIGGESRSPRRCLLGSIPVGTGESAQID